MAFVIGRTAMAGLSAASSAARECPSLKCWAFDELPTTLKTNGEDIGPATPPEKPHDLAEASTTRSLPRCRPPRRSGLLLVSVCIELPESSSYEQHRAGEHGVI
jgi:hypothetical protein